MHDGMPYDPIKVMGLLKFQKLHFSTSLPFTMGAGKWSLILN